ncbi:hypothetical protein ACFYO5_35550 [Streptomyces sp. NPDC006259]
MSGIAARALIQTAIDESLTWSSPVGAAIMLAGAALTQVRPK